MPPRNYIITLETVTNTLNGIKKLHEKTTDPKMKSLYQERIKQLESYIEMETKNKPSNTTEERIFFHECY